MDVEKQPDEVAQRLGASLTVAREANGLTITDVANQLHLKQSFVQALETGDYQVIGSMVYVKGYLRIYLRLLHLSNESDIALLKADTIATDKAKTNYADVLSGRDKVTKSTVKYGKSRKFFLKKVAVLVLLLLVILWLIALLFKYGASKKVLNTPLPVMASQPLHDDLSQQRLLLPPSTMATKTSVPIAPKMLADALPATPVPPRTDTDGNN